MYNLTKTYVYSFSFISLNKNKEQNLTFSRHFIMLTLPQPLINPFWRALEERYLSTIESIQAFQ